jgi:hypothetical protein
MIIGTILSPSLKLNSVGGVWSPYCWHKRTDALHANSPNCWNRCSSSHPCRILRILARSPGISQKELAQQLNAHASHLVALIDALEKRERVAREPNPEDRRVMRYTFRQQAGSTGGHWQRDVDPQ